MKLPMKKGTFRFVFILASIFTIYKCALENTNIFGDTLLDIKYFKYQIINDICRRNPIFMIMIVHTAPTHSDFRNTIRVIVNEAALDLDLNIEVAFLLGLTNDSQVDAKIRNESTIFGDIIQGNFLDSYRNLTYKHVMGLKWAAEHCSNVQFIVKFDDDIFVNVYKLVDFLRTQEKDFGKKDILCNVFEGIEVNRSSSSKWFVSKEEYPREQYPTYCSGWIEILRPSLAQDLVSTSEGMKPFWIDDVFVTGIIGAQIEIEFVDMYHHISSNIKAAEDWISSYPYKNYDFAFIAVPVGRDNKLYQDLYSKSAYCYRIKCPDLPDIHRNSIG